MSDRKAKENIQRLDDDACLSSILELKPCKYNYKTDESKAVRRGVIAQEARQYANEDEEGTLRIQLYDMIADLVGSVKALHARLGKK